MPLSTVATSTPNYVLIDGNLPTGPRVVRIDATTECSVMYGFSGKGPYDKFRTNSRQALKPYPLVKGYLRNQMEAPGESLKLVVIDAAGPREPYVQAATIEAVLEAQESGAAHVTSAYRLAFDEQTNAYRVDTQCDVEEQ
jgi:hypothetical protein